MLSPHIALTLLSFGTVWSFSPLPDAYTAQHYVDVVSTSSTYITNTLLYAGLAAGIDVVFGTAIAYVVWRTGLPGRKLLDYMAMGAVAIPGVVLGIGYLRTFYQFDVPFIDKPLASWWVIIVIALAIRRLPYALRACVAALQQVELSATIMLVSQESDAPLAYGIYEFMQSASGRGPGAALGIIAVLIIGIATYLSHRVINKKETERAPQQAAAPEEKVQGA